MASDIALAVVGKIVEKTVDPVVDTVVRHFSYLFCYKQNIQNLVDELVELDVRREGVQQRIVEAGWNLETPDPTVKLWLTNVDDVKSKATVVREGTSNVEKGCLNGWCPNLKRRYLLSRNAAKLSAHIGQLKRQGEKDPKFSHPARPIGIVVSSVSPKGDGFKGYATRIATLNHVMDSLNDYKINLVGISGMGGVGKTTLVNQVLAKVQAESLFKEVAMAVVSQKPDSIKIQGEIAQMLGLKFEEGSNSIARAERLCARLKNGGRVLVVLDDIWERIDLSEVGIPAVNGCKVVLTTRNEYVCIEMEVQRHIKVDMLSQPEAWDLFRKEAGDSVEDNDIRDIAKDVAKECGGLPIAIVTLGKALSKRKKHEWEDTMLKLKQASGMTGKVKSSILLSYDFLGSRKPEAQPLLLLCTLFQEDTNIPIEQLVKYSMGLDLLSKEVVTLEQTRNRVCTLVDNLKFCNLLLQGDGKYADLCVRLHDVVRDVCTSIASNPPHAYLVSHAKEMKQWPIHNGDKSDHTAIALTSGAMNELPGGLDYPNLHLLQLQLQLESENIVEIPEEFFQGMRGLKVFNFDGKIYEYGSQCDVRVPETLGHLTNLQALSFENCILSGDVSSIGCLKGLKILSFYRSQLWVWFPNEEVGALKNLKLLDLRCHDYEACGLELESCVLSGLDQLEVLYMGACFVFSENVKELKSLCCLTTLQVSVSNWKILLELEQPFFEKLKRFDIFIGSEGGFSCGDYGIIQNNITQCEDDLSWVSHAKLRSLVRRIQSLKLECLEEERFMSDERESGFSGLVNLESLKIQDMEHLIQIVPPDGKIPDGSFPGLQVVWLRDLPALKHLWSRGPAQPPSLSNLQDVTIICCDSIESLFSLEVAKCMLQLEKLTIQLCESLEGVVASNQGKEGFKNIQFPNLKSMDLDKLPNFKSFFYPDSGDEDLDGDCDTIHTLFNQWVSFPSLEKIELVGVGNVEVIVGYQMEDVLANKLRSIFVSMCNELKSFVDSTMLENLEEVHIYRCDSMKVVFDLEGLKVGEEDSAFVFDKLASIYLNGLKKLAHVWRMVPDSIQGFRNVTTLVVKRCNELRYLMLYSVAKMLVNLQDLELGQCDKIVGVIEGEDEEECSREAKSNGCIVFPQLQELELEDLQNLTSFCSSKYSLEFPLLEFVEIRGCPDMKNFCGGEVKAPVLKEPVEDAEEDEWFWKGNLNNGNNRAKRQRL